jgi:phage terminase large subunit-like protein
MTKLPLPNLFRENLLLFVERAFRFSTGRRLEGGQGYIEYICYYLAAYFIPGDRKRLLVNLPGRHLKTFIFSICLPAFMLGHDPTLRFMIVAYDKALAEDIVRQIRDIMESSWYQQIFRTRLCPKHSRKADFGVIGGGRVRAVPVRSVTGKGGDIIIFDDPHNATDWDNQVKKNRVLVAFSMLMTRRDLGENTGLLVVGHRVAIDDLSASILERDDFSHICLPLFAPKDMRFEMGDNVWHLRKGEALRPDAFSAKTINKLKEEHLGSPFGLHFQQGLGRQDDSLEICIKHFPFFKGEYRGLPVVISVDPASKTASRSRNVIHVYAVDENAYVLLQAFAERCSFLQLRRMVEKYAKRYNACLILIEETARGGDLIEELRSKVLANIEAIIPRLPKAVRLRKFAGVIRDRRIRLKNRPNVEEAIDEIVTFPNAPCDDHLDALLNFLDRASRFSREPLPPARRTAQPPIALALGSALRRAPRPVQGGVAGFYGNPKAFSIMGEPRTRPGSRSPYQAKEDPIVVVHGGPGQPIKKRIG